MRTLALVAAALWALHAAPAQAAELSPACAAKRASIEAQIAEARAHGRKHELAGLKKALRNNQAHCTDRSLAKQREAQIRQAQRKLAAREQGLREAEAKGDAKKIADRTAKLEQARRELAEAEQPLPH